MKHRTVSTGVGSTLFILMIVTALACVRPVYLRLSAALTVLEQQVLSVVEQRTGLVVSYEKLAPSVLSALNLKGVSLSDAVTGKKIADIRRITVSYRFPDFFSKKPLYAIKSVSVTGVTLEYDAVKDGALLEKWRLLMPEEKKEVRPEKRTIDFANLSLNLPFLVQLKNISLHYSDAKNDALLTVKRIALTSQFDGNGVEVKTEGRFTCRSDALMEGKRRAVLASSFSVDGVFYPDLNGSAANLRLVAENTADYTVTNADLLVNYADSKLQVRSMRSVLPYSLYLEADSQTGTVFTSLSFENFEPLSLVRIKRMPQRLRKFSGTTVNGSAQASFSKKTGVSFSVDGSVTLPAAVMAAAGGAGTGVSGAGTNSPGTGNGAGSSVANASGAVSGTARSASASSAVSGAAVTVSTKIHGDSDSIQIEKLSASGKTVQADFTGSYDVRQKQPSGVFSLEYFVLGNGNVISTEVYLEPLSAGFMCFSPQLFLGDRSLTALQLTAIPAVDSWDFVFECDDYSHADFEQSGHVRMEGSWLKGTGAGGAYVQSQVSVNNLFVDSMLYDAAFFLSASSGKSLSAAAKNLSPYIMSSDLYLSSDFHSFSFNAPFFILANTQNDHELLMFAADGSNQTVQLSNFELQFGSMSASANIQADFDRGFDDFTFFGSATVNALPYSFNGNYARRWLSVSGDYGFEAVLSLADEVTGSVRFSQLPVAAGKNVFAFSTESSFSWSEETGPTAELYSFSMEDASGASSLNPRMTVSGSMNHNSFVFSSLSYSDSVSELDGSGNILWNVNNGIFDSIHIDFDARSPLYSEQISLAADFVNPTQVPFSAAALQNDFYVSVQAKLTAFPLGRLLREQGSDNVLTATATVTGTVANPFVTMQVEHAALSLNGSPLLAHGTFSLDDTGVHIAGISGSWRNMKLSDLSADFNLTTMNGHAGCVFEGDVLGQGFTVPLEVSMESLPSEDSRLLKDFTLTASSKKVSGALFPKPFPFELTLIHTQDRYDLFSNGGFTASLLSDGTVYAKTSDASKLTFELNGNVSKNGMNLEFSRVRADLAHISSNFYFEWVQFTAGLLTGSFRVKGLLSDPEFGGELTVSNPVFTIPFVSEQAFKGKLVVAAFSESTMNVDPTRFECGRGLLDAGVRIDFDRWGLEQLAVTLNGVEDKLVPVDMTFPLVHYKGNALVNLGLTLTSTDFSVTGSIFGQNGDINIQTSSWQSFLSGDNLALSGLFTKKEESAPLPFDFSCDLRVIAGNKVQILYDPFLRGLIVPGTVLNFGLSTGTGDFSLKGDIALRGGEIIWLNRNFYMKEGRIVFNENQDILDPRLTVRAETRERDSGGNAVTISLSASSQPVSRFNPRLSASPAKSEAEIMELLGQVVSADSDSIGSVAMAGGDYLVNAMVMRRIETALRDLTNFDIFSVRTMVLQNAVSQSTRSNSSENSTTFGNFFDNSAVYIGKYFGSSVYVDALMQWTYDETKSVDNGDVSSLVFHPEFGFEMSSPFVNIRWGIAPDVEALQTRKPWFVPSASITLSWKISF